MKLALPLLAFAAACAVPPADESQVTQGLRCDDWGCGTNSATVGDGLIFDEIDSSGAMPNSAGLKIVGATAGDGTPVHVYVKRQELRARSLVDGHEYIGVDLVGTIVQLTSSTGVVYEVKVTGVQQKALLFFDGAPEWVPFYELKTRKPAETQKWDDYACKYDVIDSDPHWTGLEHKALVFQWDRYDAVHKTVTETATDDPWFNIACAATATAKMHLLRHTRAGSYNDSGVIAYDTTVDQRQAMLKMLTADYCGMGQSFTRDGVPLVYDTANGLYIDRRDMIAKESMWTSSGAICIDTPRLDVTPGDMPSTPAGTPTMTAIMNECHFVPPPCNGFDKWTSRSYVISGKPSTP
jgi:hypothetical protein